MRVWFCVFFAGLAVICGFAGAGENESEYYALILSGQKIGYAVSSREVAAGKVTTTEDVYMTLSRAGMALAINTTETSIETTRGKPVGFESTQNMSGIAMKVTGKVTSAGKMEITTEAMGSVQQQAVDIPAGALMAEGIRLLQRKKGLKEGTMYDALIFSPSLQGTIQAQVLVGKTESMDLFGRVVRLTEVSVVMQTPGGAINSTSYVDSEFRAMKTVVPVMGMQLEMVACDKAFAFSDNDVVDFIDKMLIVSPVSLKDAKSKKAITYYLAPTGGGNLSIPSTDNQTAQRIEGGGYAVTVRPVAIPAGQKFPYKGKDAEILEALKPTTYLQSNAAEIVALARQAVGTTKDAGKAAKQIEAFVGEYITEKDFSVGYASASEVAASRQGDCSEHAVLTAAMCRAVGIPARVACGVAYIEEFAGRTDVFGGHAWTEAYIGGKWVGLDAIRTPGGFSPVHITLVTSNGEPGDFFAMASTLGYFKIEKIVIE